MSLIGITHREDGTPVVRETKVLKISIGVPKGRANYVYTFQGRWIIRFGAWEGPESNKKLVMQTAKATSDGKSGFPTRQEAQAWYAENKGTFAVSNRPQKLPFFTFTRRTIVDVKGKPEESFEPDWDAIELHGDTPREIDVVFMSENPLFQEYQSWSKTELRCHGDGLNAQRLVTIGNGTTEWQAAKDAGSKHYQVTDCAVSGKCSFAIDRTCKPTSVITFQLAKSIRLGATAYFTTTGIESAVRLFSSLQVIGEMAQRVGSPITSTPMKLVVGPYQTNHKGIAAMQHAVSVEFRAQDVGKLRAALEEAAWKPREVKQLETVSDDASLPLLTASSMNSEFYEAEFEDIEQGGEVVEAPAVSPASASAAVATATKTEALRERLATAAAVPEPALPPADKPLDQLNHQERLYRLFWDRLGPATFGNVLQATIGKNVPSAVNASNYQKVAEAMKAAAAGAPEAVPVAQDLF